MFLLRPIFQMLLFSAKSGRPVALVSSWFFPGPFNKRFWSTCEEMNRFSGSEVRNCSMLHASPPLPVWYVKVECTANVVNTSTHYLEYCDGSHNPP